MYLLPSRHYLIALEALEAELTGLRLLVEVPRHHSGLPPGGPAPLMPDKGGTDGYVLDAGWLLGQDHELRLVVTEDHHMGRRGYVFLGIWDGEEAGLMVQVGLLSLGEPNGSIRPS